MNRKLRLILWSDCLRSCPGCCNKDWDVDNLPVCDSYYGYDEIILTGGEPMLYPKKLCAAIHSIRKVTIAPVRVPIYVYTADVTNLLLAQVVAVMSDGLTVTLHEQSDVADFIKFASALDEHSAAKGLSLRVNVFAGVDLDPDAFPSYWKVKDGIEWIDNCPLPKGEVLMRYVREEKKT